MLGAIALLVGGAVVLTAGAEAAIRGAGLLVRRRGGSLFVLGALLFGVDLESLGAALIAAGRGQTSIAAGEAFGTIVFLFSAAFGAALLVSPRPVESPGSTMVLLPAASAGLGAIALTDSVVTRPEGSILVVAYALYVGLVLQEGRVARAAVDHLEREMSEGSRLPPPVLLIGGLALVYGGATLLVSGGVGILDRTSLSAGFVGAAVIGALASADELLLEILPVRRGTPELATGNLFGTLAAFTSGALGLAALIHPLFVDSAAASAYLAATVLYAVVATVFLVRGRAGRVTGLLVLAGYAGWIVWAARI